MSRFRGLVLGGLCFTLIAGPAAALPLTGAYVSVSPTSPRVMAIINVYDGVVELTYVPHQGFANGQFQYGFVGSLRFPLQVMAEHEKWPTITALIGYQRQQGGIGNATNAVEYGFKADKVILPWVSVHGLLTNASVLHATTPQGSVPTDLLVMPRVEIGASFCPAPPVYFLVGFTYWTAPAQLNTPTTFMRGIIGYPGLILGINWQFSDLFGLPEPGQAMASPSPAPEP